MTAALTISTPFFLITLGIFAARSRDLFFFSGLTRGQVDRVMVLNGLVICVILALIHWVPETYFILIGQLQIDIVADSLSLSVLLTAAEGLLVSILVYLATLIALVKRRMLLVVIGAALVVFVVFAFLSVTLGMPMNFISLPGQSGNEDASMLFQALFQIGRLLVLCITTLMLYLWLGKRTVFKVG